MRFRKPGYSLINYSWKILIGGVIIFLVSSCSEDVSIIPVKNSNDIIQQGVGLENPGNPDIPYIGPEGKTCFYYKTDNNYHLLDYPYSDLAHMIGNHELYPIPLSEIDNPDGAIEQNPYYN